MARKPQSAARIRPQASKDGAWKQSRTSSSDSNNEREPPANNRVSAVTLTLL